MTPESPKRKRTRSPNYPLLDLETAIVRVGVLHDKYDTHHVPIGMAQGCWNYKPGSSIGEQTVAALRSYGLLDVTGKGNTRKVAVSKAGDRIIRSAPDRAELVAGAAVLPKIHDELWARYHEKGIPHDDVVRTYLLWEREEGLFNKEVVDGVISRFRSTIAFAMFAQGDKLVREMEKDGDGGAPRNDGDGDGDDKRKVRNMTAPVLPLPIPMGDGKITIVDIPRMTAAAFAFFTKQLDAYKSAIVLPSEGDASSEESNDR